LFLFWSLSGYIAFALPRWCYSSLEPKVVNQLFDGAEVIVRGQRLGNWFILLNALGSCIVIYVLGRIACTLLIRLQRKGTPVMTPNSVAGFCCAMWFWYTAFWLVDPLRILWIAAYSGLAARTAQGAVHRAGSYNSYVPFWSTSFALFLTGVSVFVATEFLLIPIINGNDADWISVNIVSGATGLAIALPGLGLWPAALKGRNSKTLMLLAGLSFLLGGFYFKAFEEIHSRARHQ
jgi:hypothetical protein